MDAYLGIFLVAVEVQNVTDCFLIQFQLNKELLLMATLTLSFSLFMRETKGTPSPRWCKKGEGISEFRKKFSLMVTHFPIRNESS